MVPRQSRLQMLLYWTVALLVAVQFLMRDGIEAAWEVRRRGFDVAWTIIAAGWAHILVGIVIFLCGSLLIWLRISRRTPAFPEGWLPRGATAVEGAMLLLLVVHPITGALAWFGFSYAAAGLHAFAAWMLPALIVLHLAYVSGRSDPGPKG